MNEGSWPTPVVGVTGLRGANGVLAVAAALGVAAARAAGDGGDGGAPRGVVLYEPELVRPRRPTLVSSPAARALETRLRGATSAAARGALCWITGGEDWREVLATCRLAEASLVVAALDLDRWRELVGGREAPVASVVRADLPRHRAVAGLLAIELRCMGHSCAFMTREPGVVARRRALAGLEPGGELGARTKRLLSRLPRARDEAGQVAPIVLFLALFAVVVALLLALVGAAATGGVRLQRAADLAAVSAARSMRDDYHRLFAPRGAALSVSAYRARARRAARAAVRANHGDGARAHVAFPGRAEPPTRARVVVGGRIALDGRGTGERARAVAVAEARPAAGLPAAAGPEATRGGYGGPLAYRQGEPMRPDVADAFDRMAAAARRAGHALIVTSAFRSDAEQAALFAANPDPRWVAPPGTSLHRCATELDLGPASVYPWLAANAPRFGFTRRYAWEAWHFGFVRGPAPCSAAGDRAGDGPSGRLALPSFVPARFREPIARSAARWDVSAALLAAQLLAESGFDPRAASPAGALGIAQFMPATAAAYGLRDPFDAEAAIAAQARLMRELLGRFGTVALALAAYNAGPGAVASCGCVPPYPETQAYVARILGLLGGAGDVAGPVLEVRLIR